MPLSPTQVKKIREEENRKERERQGRQEAAQCKQLCDRIDTELKRTDPIDGQYRVTIASVDLTESMADQIAGQFLSAGWDIKFDWEKKFDWAAPSAFKSINTYRTTIAEAAVGQTVHITLTPTRDNKRKRA